MKITSTHLFLFLLLITSCMLSQNKKGPVAKFTFNNKSNVDEITGKKAKLVGAGNTEDRFGNANNAIYLFGQEFSYINLGNYKALKPRAGTISLWIKPEYLVYSGKGVEINPIILTKCASRDDFYEAYAIYYVFETKRLQAACSKDSIKQSSISSMRKYSPTVWHHLVYSYNDQYISFYIDGKLEKKMPKNFKTEFDPLDSVVVGSCANKKNNRYLNAVVDDIEFYDRVLTDKEVLKLYNAPNPNKNKIIFNWILIVVTMLIIIGLVYALVKYRLNVTYKKEKQRQALANTLLENELRINRALMNPHFIFNSLNTLHNYILMNNPEKASDYLLKFSKLIRKILDSNTSDTITLEQEIDLIKRYLEIEKLRFNEDIKSEITLDPGIIPSSITIPIMMLQPFIENAIWHGLLDKPGEKRIFISFSLCDSKYIQCIIEDNGLGRKKKEPDNLEKKSLAINFTQHRLDLLNKIHNLNCSLSIFDKPNGQGTIIQIILPILNK